jgi:hypothetical protein
MEGLEVPDALSTHPSLDRRIKRLDAKWKKLKSKGNFVTLSEEPVLRP